MTGAGVDALAGGVRELLPASPGEADGPAEGTVFKIERGPAGEPIAYVRLFAGRLRVRDRVRLPDGAERVVSAIGVFDRGAAVPRPSFRPGRSRRSTGSAASASATDRPRGPPRSARSRRRRSRGGDPPPRARPRRAARRADPARRAGPADRPSGATSCARSSRCRSTARCRRRSSRRRSPRTTASTVAFRETTTICIERPAGTGAAFEIIDTEPNPFLATVGLRIDPAAVGAGIAFRLEVELGVDAVRVLPGRRGDRPRHPAAGPARLAGRRLHGDHDPRGLLAAPEPRPRDVRQEHVEHRRGLP